MVDKRWEIPTPKSNCSLPIGRAGGGSVGWGEGLFLFPLSVQTHWALIIIFVPHVCQTLAIASRRNVKKILNFGALRVARKSPNARWQANTQVLSYYPQIADNETFG